MCNKNNLKKIRVSLGISQIELGRAIGVKQPTISAYEHGNRAIPVPVANNIIAFTKTKNLQITLEDIYLSQQRDTIPKLPEDEKLC